MSRFSVVFPFFVVAFFLTATFRPFPQVFSILILLLCLAFYFVIKFKKIPLLTLDQSEKILCLSFLAIALSVAPPLLNENTLSSALKELNIGLEYLQFALLAFLIFKLKPKFDKRFLFYSIVLASILNGCISIVQLYIQPVGRLYGYTGINEFGLICATLCVLSAILFTFEKSGKYEKIMYFIASMVNVFGVVGSQLRGVMLAIVFVWIVFFIFSLIWRRQNFKVFCFAWSAVLVGLVLFASILFVTISSKRIDYTKTELQSINRGEYDTSIGLRLQMYKEAWAMFKISPLIGLNSQERLEKATEIAEISHTTHILKQAEKGEPLYGKLHNDFLTFLGKRGLVGFLSLLFFYLAVLRICYVNRDNIFGQLGFGLVLLYFGVGMSGDPLGGYAEFAFFGLTFLFVVAAKNLQCSRDGNLKI